MVLGLIFAEYHKGLTNFLRCDEFADDDPNYASYLQSLQKIKGFLGHLYFEFKTNLEQQ